MKSASLIPLFCQNCSPGVRVAPSGNNPKPLTLNCVGGVAVMACWVGYPCVASSVGVHLPSDHVVFSFRNIQQHPETLQNGHLPQIMTEKSEIRTEIPPPDSPSDPKRESVV